jgi:ABC-type polysaccharide/polyol phosphate transport system ATPase subunit
MAAVNNYCTRAVLIEKGKIAIDGSPAEVADAYDNLFKSR